MKPRNQTKQIMIWQKYCTSSWKSEKINYQFATSDSLRSTGLGYYGKNKHSDFFLFSEICSYLLKKKPKIK